MSLGGISLLRRQLDDFEPAAQPIRSIPGFQLRGIEQIGHGPAVTTLEYGVLEPSSLQIDQNGGIGDQDDHQESARAPSIH